MRKPVPAAEGTVVRDETQLQPVYLNMYLTRGQPDANVYADVGASLFAKLRNGLYQS